MGSSTRQQRLSRGNGPSSYGASEDLPPYSTSEVPSSSNAITARPTIQGNPKLDFSAYRAASGELSKDQLTITVSSPMLQNANPLITFLKAQAALPPRPGIRIKGKHSSQTDFDLRINMMAYFLPPNEGPPLSYLKATPSTRTERSARQDDLLRTVAAAYSAETTKKRLVLTRRTSKWGFEYLEGRLRYLLADLKYKGDVSIESTTTYGCVTVKPPSGSGFGAVWSSVSDAFLEARKFEVEVVWPYANVQRGGDGRVCNVADEGRWWNDWKKAITYAVLNRP